MVAPDNWDHTPYCTATLRMMFDDMDTDGSGTLDKAEVAAALQRGEDYGFRKLWMSKCQKLLSSMPPKGHTFEDFKAIVRPKQPPSADRRDSPVFSPRPTPSPARKTSLASPATSSPRILISPPTNACATPRPFAPKPDATSGPSDQRAKSPSAEVPDEPKEPHNAVPLKSPVRKLVSQSCHRAFFRHPLAPEGFLPLSPSPRRLFAVIP